MTSTPPPSPEGSSLPPRHRPSLGNLAQDTTERDLWDFDDDIESVDGPEMPRIDDERPRTSGSEIPAPRERQPGKTPGAKERPESKAPAGAERIRMDVGKARYQHRPAGKSTGQSKPERDFDDLENWEDAPAVPEIEDLPSDVAPESISSVPPVEPTVEEKSPAGGLVRESEGDGGSGADVQAGGDNEFSPVARENPQPVSLRPHLKLSLFERFGLISLLVLILGGATAILVFSLNLLPTEPAKAKANDFPIKGGKFTVNSATSYWRAPVTGGPSPDMFRRGTRLLPVLELNVSGGPGAVRVLFRNDDRSVVGDMVTRAIRDGSSLTIPATAGFDDPGMHAAYRTGESKPWTIEVFEAPSEDAAGKDFKKLFEMNISTELR